MPQKTSQSEWRQKSFLGYSTQKANRAVWQTRTASHVRVSDRSKEARHEPAQSCVTLSRPGFLALSFRYPRKGFGLRLTTSRLRILVHAQLPGCAEGPGERIL